MEGCKTAGRAHLHSPISQLWLLHGLRDLIQVLLQICDALIPLQHSGLQLQDLLAKAHATGSQGLQILLQKMKI